MSRLRFVVCVVVAALVIPAFGARGAGAQERLSIATGGTGGVYYPYGGALANLISDQIEDVEVTAEVTSASIDNMLLIDSQDADLAFALADTVFDAAQGNDPFVEAVPARSLATLYNHYTHLLTTVARGGIYVAGFM